MILDIIYIEHFRKVYEKHGFEENSFTFYLNKKLLASFTLYDSIKYFLISRRYKIKFSTTIPL